MMHQSNFKVIIKITRIITVPVLLVMHNIVGINYNKYINDGAIPTNKLFKGKTEKQTWEKWIKNRAWYIGVQLLESVPGWRKFKW